MKKKTKKEIEYDIVVDDERDEYPTASAQERDSTHLMNWEMDKDCSEDIQSMTFDQQTSVCAVSLKMTRSLWKKKPFGYWPLAEHQF